MTFVHFIKKVAPDYCGVHPSFGEIALLVHEAETFGKKAFGAEAFNDCRERASMVAPYGLQSKDPVKYKEVLDIIEYAICQHRQKNHGEDFNERIGQLSKEINLDIFEGETLEASTRGWWNG